MRRSMSPSRHPLRPRATYTLNKPSGSVMQIFSELFNPYIYSQRMLESQGPFVVEMDEEGNYVYKVKKPVMLYDTDEEIEDKEENKEEEVKKKWSEAS